MIALATSVQFFSERDATRLFVWGCTIALYLGLTTLETGPLDGSPLEEQIDAQRVNAMFVAVGVMLTLCQIFAFLATQEGKSVDHYEEHLVDRSDRLTLWACGSKSFFRSTRRVHEGCWMLILLVLYGTSLSEFVAFTTQELSLRGEGFTGTRSVLAVTAGGLLLPFIVFARAARAKGLGFYGDRKGTARRQSTSSRSQAGY